MSNSPRGCRSMRRRRTALALGGALALLGGAAGSASAHPHVFAEARMEIVGDTAGKLTSIRNIWRMDELFSTSVVLDYDKNANGILDDDELQAVGDTVKESIAEWSFYTFVRADGKIVPLEAPADIRALYQDNQLLMFFEMKVKDPVDLKAQAVTVSNFDETFFVAFDFADDASFQLVDMPQSCTRAVVVPDEDEAAKEWMSSIASLGPDETVPADGVDYAQVLATRAEIKCG
ncbi:MULTISPECIES: DUF1007 family protein [unclassified Aureimonas]|uniref:DUF1007 family protein n=1 Tax=unclassified Aureimonas TaxID=2615206 RepID=UPI000B227776|nr:MULTISPECIES: DUF1007 family protein [unclassified Aureimonas]